MVDEEVVQARCLEHTLQDRIPSREIKNARHLHEASIAYIPQARWRPHGATQATGTLRLNHTTTASPHVAG